jgi:hypothetical protein
MSKRKRGFAPYSPKGFALQLIENIKGILDEYRLAGILPITLRQLFYRLVVLYAYEKTEKAYKSLGETLNRARRAAMISMDHIRDDGFNLPGEWWYEDKADFWSNVEHSAKSFTLDRQALQDRRVLLWCEANGMRPQLQRIARPYGIRVASSGGFDSTTTKHAIAKALAVTPTTVLHIGDYDPSGVHMFGNLDEDVTAFVKHYGGDVEFNRIAVLPEHIEEYNLPTSPPKDGDKRSFDDNRTVQAEAFDPATLAAIVRTAVEKHVDIAAVERMKELEQAYRLELISQIPSFD